MGQINFTFIKLVNKKIEYLNIIEQKNFRIKL